MNHKQSFTEYYEGRGYASETLINGNFSHCVEYLRGLLDYKETGLKTMLDELDLIRENCPERYEAIKNRVCVKNC